MFIELQTTVFTRSIKANKNTTFQLTGVLTGGEVIAFEKPDGAGGWSALSVGGTAVTLSATNHMVSFDHPVLVRLSKPVTVALAGVMVVS